MCRPFLPLSGRPGPASTFIFSLSGQPQLLAGGTRAHVGGLALPSSWGHESKRRGPSASPGLSGTPFLFGSPDSPWKLEPRDWCARDKGEANRMSASSRLEADVASSSYASCHTPPVLSSLKLCWPGHVALTGPPRHSRCPQAARLACCTVTAALSVSLVCLWVGSGQGLV